MDTVSVESTSSNNKVLDDLDSSIVTGPTMMQQSNNNYQEPPKSPGSVERMRHSMMMQQPAATNGRRTTRRSIKRSNFDETNNNQHTMINGADGEGGSVRGLGELRRVVQKNRQVAMLTNRDIQTLEKLGDDCDQQQAEHDVQFAARVKSTRQCTFFAFVFIVFVEVVSITVCMRKGGYKLSEAMLFTHYTMTTSGYGNYNLPDTVPYQLFLCWIMLAGIAAVTIMVSQMYQFIALSRSRAQHTVDKSAMAASTTNGGTSYLESQSPKMVDYTPTPKVYRLSNKGGRNTGPRKAKHESAHVNALDMFFGAFDSFQHLVTGGTYGRLISVTLYLVALLVSGAVAMMIMEGWTFLQGLYFATFTMTTVGYGDLTPTKESSTWFTVFWLPLNVSFLSIYMGNLVRVYAWVATSNIDRNKATIRSVIDKSKDDDNSNDATANHRAAIVKTESGISTKQTAIKTMKDVISFVRANAANDNIRSTAIEDLLTIESTSKSSLPFQENGARNPSFVLLVLVQERIAQIIATEIAGYQSQIHIRNNTAAVTVDTLSDTADKWCVPKLARNAFVTVAFETYLYVGEHHLVTEGSDAVFRLTPIEAHELMSPFLAALGDAGTMEGWMARTESLARSYL